LSAHWACSFIVGCSARRTFSWDRRPDELPSLSRLHATVGYLRPWDHCRDCWFQSEDRQWQRL